MDESNKELTTEELQSLKLEVQQKIDEVKEIGENLSYSEIRGIFPIWSKMQNFVVRNHPEKTVASRISNLFNDYISPHFKQTLKRQ